MRDDDPKDAGPKPPFKTPQQEPPGETREMAPQPDHGEHSYKGSGKLAGRAALITGADSGIGRAVAIAFAREGADILIGYLEEHEDAQETARWVEQAGRKPVLMAGDIADPTHCKKLVARAVEEFGRLDILVNNAAYQMTYHSLDEISEAEWDKTFRTNIYSMFYLAKAAVPHMKPGSAIVNTSSINAKSPNPTLLAYATTKGAIANFTAGQGDPRQLRRARTDLDTADPVDDGAKIGREIRREHTAWPAGAARRAGARLRAARER